MAILTIDEIKEKIKPIAEKYKIPTVWIFGSYARGEATEESDVDLLIDTENSLIADAEIFNVYGEIEELFNKANKNISLITLEELNEDIELVPNQVFKESVVKNRIKIYG